MTTQLMLLYNCSLQSWQHLAEAASRGAEHLGCSAPLEAWHAWSYDPDHFCYGFVVVMHANADTVASAAPACSPLPTTAMKGMKDNAQGHVCPYIAIQRDHRSLWV